MGNFSFSSTNNTPGGISISPYTTGSLTSTREEYTAGSHSIAAGKVKVSIRNTGLEDITVDGTTVSPGGEKIIEAFSDDSAQTVYFTPAISITVPVGGSAWAEIIEKA